MPYLIFIILALAGILFVIKVCYVLSTAGAVHVTQGALFVSTSRIRINAFLEALPMQPGQVLYDLGCGDGRVLRAANQRYGVRAVGFEINPMAYFLAKIKSIGRNGVKIKYGGFNAYNIGEADVVFCYLFPDVLKAIRDKLESELKPGAYIVSCNFPLPGLSPERVIRPQPALHADPIYIYRRKASA